MSDNFKIVNGAIGAQVNPGQSFTIPYPAGTTSDSYYADGHTFILNGQRTYTEPEQVEIVFDDSTINVTNNTTQPWMNGDAYEIQLNTIPVEEFTGDVVVGRNLRVTGAITGDSEAVNYFAADPTSNPDFDSANFKLGLELGRDDVGLDGVPPYFFLITGDSMSQSYSPAGGGGSDWPTQLFAKSNWSGRGAVVNTAASSETLATISTRWASVEGKEKPAAASTSYCFTLGGHNDLNASATAATCEGYLTTIWSLARADGHKVVAFTIPEVPSLTGAKATERTALNTWIRLQSDKWDYCIDIADLSGTTVDNTHQTKAGNGTVATRIDNAIGAPWTAKPSPAKTFFGKNTGFQLSRHEPGFDGRTNPAVSTADSISAIRPYFADNGAPIYPAQFPRDRGIHIGDNGNSGSATLASAISVGTGDFFFGAWVRIDSRYLSSSSNTVVLLYHTGSSTLLGIAAGSTHGGQPYLLGNGNNYIPVDCPLIRPDRWCYVAWQRGSGKFSVSVDTVFSGAIDCTESLTFDAAFGDGSSSSAFTKGDVGEFQFKLANHTTAQVCELFRGASFEKVNTSASAALWVRFDAGAGFIAYDQSSNKRHIKGRVDNKAMEWLFPRRTGTLRATTTTSGNEELTGQISIPSNARIASWTIYCSGGAVTVSLGVTSGGTTLASGVSLTNSALNAITLTTPIPNSQDLWVNSSGNSTLEHYITYEIVR